MLRAECLGGLASLAGETLVANEGRVAGGAVEALWVCAAQAKKSPWWIREPGARWWTICAASESCSTPTLLGWATRKRPSPQLGSSIRSACDLVAQATRERTTSSEV